MVARARVRADQRVKALALTSSGVEVRERLIATLAESAMFARLTPAEQRQLADLLGRCADPSRGPATPGDEVG